MADFEESFIHELSMNRAKAMFRRKMSTMLAHLDGQQERILHLIGLVKLSEIFYILLLAMSLYTQGYGSHQKLS